MKDIENKFNELKIELNEKLGMLTDLISVTAENTEMAISEKTIRTIAESFEGEISLLKDEIMELKNRVDSLEHTRMPSSE